MEKSDGIQMYEMKIKNHLPRLVTQTNKALEMFHTATRTHGSSIRESALQSIHFINSEAIKKLDSEFRRSIAPNQIDNVLQNLFGAQEYVQPQLINNKHPGTRSGKQAVWTEAHFFVGNHSRPSVSERDDPVHDTESIEDIQSMIHREEQSRLRDETNKRKCRTSAMKPHYNRHELLNPIYS